MRARLAALVPGILLALFLGAGEASAQTAVCSDTPGANDRILCSTGSAADLSVTTSNVAISTTGSSHHGVYLRNTKGTWADGESADITIRMTGGSVSTAGGFAYGVYARMADRDSAGAITVDLINADVRTTGSSAHGVYTYYRGDGAHAIRMSGGSIEAAGQFARGVYAYHHGDTGKLTLDLSGGASVKGGARAIYVTESTSDGTAVTLSDVSLESSGGTALYVSRVGRLADDASKGDLVISLTEATITARPSARFGSGVTATDTGVGDILVNFESGRIRAGAVEGEAVDLEQGFDYNPSGGSVANAGGWSENTGEGSITATIGAETAIESPFAIGVKSVTGNPKVGTGASSSPRGAGSGPGRPGLSPMRRATAAPPSGKDTKPRRTTRPERRP